MMRPAASADRLQRFGPPAVLRGVVRYRGELAQQGYRLNRFLVDISQHDQRQAYLDDEDGAMARAQLSEDERTLLRNRDYRAMLAYGVNIYALAKAGYVFGHTLLEIGAQMRRSDGATEAR